MYAYHMWGTAVWERRGKFTWIVCSHREETDFDCCVGHCLTPYRYCHLFLSRGGSVTFIVTSIDDLLQDEIEVSCKSKFQKDKPGRRSTFLWQTVLNSILHQMSKNGGYPNNTVHIQANTFKSEKPSIKKIIFSLEKVISMTKFANHYKTVY